MKKSEGKLIVISGPDGCGKKIQTGLLMDRLKKIGYDAETIDFPQYKENFFGEAVGRYLRGDFGESGKVSPYLASILYAGDRWESMQQINQWLESGKIIVCDRYVGDNFLHQGSKIVDFSDREKFFDWLGDLEFGVFSARRADMIFYLDVSLEISLALLEKKDAKERKDYTGGKKDGHENIDHLSGVRKISEDLIKRFGWTKIDCVPKGALLPKEEISVILWNLIKNSLPIVNPGELARADDVSYDGEPY